MERSNERITGHAGLGSEGDVADERSPVLSILVVQDHPLLAAAIAEILEAEAGVRVCGISRTGAGAILIATREKPAVVLMDFHLSDMSGPVAAGVIRAGSPDTAIVFHSADDSEVALLDAIDAGAIAYLTKSSTADQIVEAVRRAGRREVLIPVALFAKAIARQRQAVIDGHERGRRRAEFTPRELDVLGLMAGGLDTAAMAQRLEVAPHTIEWHVRHVIEKLRVHSKLQAVIASARLGLIDL